MITSKEYELLKQYRAKGYGWIARSEKGNLCAFKVMPVKSTPFWTVERGFHLPCLVGERGDNILTCVTWEDEEPTKIDDLINDYESHQVIVGESEKVIIPSFVADWIEEVKTLERPFKLEYLFDTTEMPDDVYDWLDEQVGDTDILARAWLDGYRVEKEKLYYIKFSENQYAQRFDESKIDSILVNDKVLAGRFTEEQIKKMNPHFWLLAVEVE